jgi:cytochrome P450
MLETAPPLNFTRTSKLDPPAEWALWRGDEPLRKVQLWDGSTAWVALSYAAVRAVFKDHERFKSQPATAGFPTINEADSATKASALMPMVDRPVHTVLREAVMREFILKRIEALRPETEQLVSELLDDIEAQGPPTDLVAAYATAVPARFTCLLIGVPYEDAAFFRSCLDVRFSPGSNTSSVYGADDQLRAYFRRLVAERDREPTGDLASRLVLDNVRPGTLSAEDAAALLHVLLIGGFDTTKQMIAMGTLTLLQHQDQLSALRAEPSRWRLAVQELLRYLSVIQLERRACVADTEVCGQVIRAGEGVLTVISAANRDPAVFTEPDRFDISRKEMSHVAFGFGIHQCLGQPVARMLLAVALPALFDRLPGLRTAVPFEHLLFNEGRNLYGLAELPLTWTAR